MVEIYVSISLNAYDKCYIIWAHDSSWMAGEILTILNEITWDEFASLHPADNNVLYGLFHGKQVQPQQQKKNDARNNSENSHAMIVCFGNRETKYLICLHGGIFCLGPQCEIK